VTRARADAALAGRFLGSMIPNVGGLALTVRLTALPQNVVEDRNMIARVCSLRPEALPQRERLLALTVGVHPAYRANVLCRLGRDDEAVAELTKWRQYPLPLLFLALAECHRGNYAEAREALAQANEADSSGWSWTDRQEVELLRREVEAQLTP
jgi:hypothetical protein